LEAVARPVRPEDIKKRMHGYSIELQGEAQSLHQWKKKVGKKENLPLLTIFHNIPGFHTGYQPHFHYL